MTERKDPDVERALTFARGLEREANAALRRLAWRASGSGGQHVSFHGDFASVAAPSALNKIKWWTREIRQALGDQDPEVED